MEVISPVTIHNYNIYEETSDFVKLYLLQKRLYKSMKVMRINMVSE